MTMRPPAAAERVVFTAARAAGCAARSVEMSKVLPGLKPYQPTQRMKVPRTTSTEEWPVICTTPEPAKSMQPPTKVASWSALKAESQPAPDQHQWTTTGYTKPVRKKV